MVGGERLGDRRSDMRFEIVGELWGRLAAAQPLPILDLTPNGMRVELAAYVHVGSRQELRLTIGDEVNRVSATVRHVTPVLGKPNSYVVGLAFTQLPPELRQRIETLCATGLGGDAVQGA